MAGLFDAVEAAIAARSSGIDSAARALGAAFERAPTRSTDVFDVLTAQRSRAYPAVMSAELRVDRRTGKIRQIIIDVDADAFCTPDDEVLRHFGSSPELSVPTPRQPADSPLFYVYHHPWGDLRIGVSPIGQRCVETIVTQFVD